MYDARIWKFWLSGKIHQEAWFFVKWIIFLTAIVCLTPMARYWYLGLISIFLVIHFFRDPDRIITNVPNALISPADGMVVEVLKNVELPSELQMSGCWHKIGIFLAPWNVHINRMPISGCIEKKVYQSGSFKCVSTTETPRSNEHLSLVIQLPSEERVVCVQIAGFLARRIICSVQETQEVVVGQKYGLICFGSRVDVYVPTSFEIFIQAGQKAIGGETILGFVSKQAL
jgi:phosphatidylserine decarboxylase